jgi:GMP synthase-like glutamine amidotransferase
MARALVLRHHWEDHTGLIGDALETRGFEVDLRMMNADNPSPSLDGYDLMVILGSKSAVYDKEVEASWFGRELALIAEAERRDLPIRHLFWGASTLPLPRGHCGAFARTRNWVVRRTG